MAHSDHGSQAGEMPFPAQPVRDAGRASDREEASGPTDSRPPPPPAMPTFVGVPRGSEVLDHRLRKRKAKRRGDELSELRKRIIQRSGPPPTGPADVPRVKADDQQEPESLKVAAARSLPSFLTSTAFHLALLILLALIVVAQQQDDPIELTVTTSDPTDELLDQFEFETQSGVEADAEELIVTPQFLPEVQDPFAAMDVLDELVEEVDAWEQLDAPQIGLALKGREPGSREALLKRYKGSGLTQGAVERGLAWLVRNQRRDGSWSLRGPYSDGAHEMDENAVAATAMALLAFQGAGHTDVEGRHKRHVAHGWRWLLRQQDSYGNFFHNGPLNHPFYTQAQCTIALCELLGMTENEAYRDPARRAVDYLLRSQSPKGGWRYTPRGDSDVSVTGWVVMALQSARMAGLEVPRENLERITGYLDSVAMYDGSRYPYQKGRQPTLAMTAEAILCRQYLGWPRDDPRMIAALEWITEPENLIRYDRRRNTYYWYYATQVCHHMEGEYWQRWNDVMRVEMPKAQVRRGRESGSWDPDMNDPHEARAGRLYATCLSLYMLEVYYRHLPIYTNVYRELKKSEGRVKGEG